MPFCYAPWTNVNISPSGYVTPCCKFEMWKNSSFQNVNIQEHTLHDYTSSKFLTNLKLDFMQDKWPSGCDRCRIEEENGIKSKRQIDIDWNDYTNVDLSETDFVTATVAFGNACNLKCVTCMPSNSSSLRNEHKDLYKIDIKPFIFKKTDFVQEFFKNSAGLKILEIPGGEPFITGVESQKELLQLYIKSGQAENIELRYTTNGTIFPDDEWWEIWSHFKIANLQLSIDGIGTRFEYIRFPAKWNVLVENLQKFKDKTHILPNIQLCVSHTVSAYNVFYLDEFFDWCTSEALTHVWCGRVHDPDWARPSIWPDPFKSILIDKLSNSKYSQVRTWATLIQNTDDTTLYNRFKEITLARDQYRGCSASLAFPELSNFIL